MLNAIQSNDAGHFTLLIEVDVRNDEGDVIGRLPEKEYPINAVPDGALSPAEVAWITKCYPNAQIAFVSPSTP